MENWLKLKIGHLLRVTVLTGRYAGQYRSRLEEQNEEKLWIAVPLLGKDEIPAPPGSEVEVGYMLTSAAGAVGGATYSFRVPVLAVQEIPVRCLVVPVPARVVKAQLRRFVRVDCDLQVECRILPDEGQPRDEKPESFSAKARDISGGGVLLGDVPGKLALGTALEVQLLLPNTRIPEVAVGRVVRNLAADNGEKLYGIEFTAIRENTRENLIRYVYQRQRELRRRGAL